jgi:alpha-tubulin suppressor-like RCC1 family protein
MVVGCRDSLIPKAVEFLKDRVMTMIAGGWRHTIAGDSEGKLYGWGWNKVCKSTSVAVWGDTQLVN